MQLFTNQSGEALPEYVVLAASLAILSILPLSLVGETVHDRLGGSAECSTEHGSWEGNLSTGFKALLLDCDALKFTKDARPDDPQGTGHFTGP